MHRQFATTKNKIAATFVHLGKDSASASRPEFPSFFLNGCPSRDKCRRMTTSWIMVMYSQFNPTMNYEKERVSVQDSTPSIPKIETLRSGHLHFGRLHLQPSDEELVQESRFEFGQFVARQAVLDEEYWTAAWLRAESHWEDRTLERYIDNFKRKFAEQEFNAVKRRCRGQNGQSCACIITVKKELKNVVGTLDLNIQFLLQGESFPGQRVKAPLFYNFNPTPPTKYGYVANLCVAKSARRMGIASNMLYFAVESARSNGVEHVYVHVDRNNQPAQILYRKMGFELVEMEDAQLSRQQRCLLRLHI